MFKAKSTTKEAKQLIRAEIFATYTTSNKTYTDATEAEIIEAIQNMKADADAYNCNEHPSKQFSDWAKGAKLVGATNFRIWFDDIAEFLEKIYGASVHDWSMDKAFKTYASLIGREYAQLVRKYQIK